ncbi:hypothetical protein SBOR_0309 [Sclerotinia borealis F-4128]|uniref:Uncharacterized protein n=1 Tax=Sclerotinia borealis (strain F-4128) TaxID=1432307 RepID=W9CT11_SCLBF|nr:hypothetical protein SBOR_0309 [Sclerotinia borealis F-4128]
MDSSSVQQSMAGPGDSSLSPLTTSPTPLPTPTSVITGSPFLNVAKEYSYLILIQEIEVAEEEQTGVVDQEYVEELLVKLERAGELCLDLVMGIYYLKYSGTAHETNPHGAKIWDSGQVARSMRLLRETYEYLDPVGYRDDLFAVRSLGVEAKDEVKSMCSVADLSTVVDDAGSIGSGMGKEKEKEKEKKKKKETRYEAWVLRYVPAHVRVESCYKWLGIRYFSRTKEVPEEWSFEPLASHPAEIQGLRHRFMDAARNKFHACGLQVEIMAGGELEKRMQENYLKEVVRRLGEVAERRLLRLCVEREGGTCTGSGVEDVDVDVNVRRKWGVVSIEARVPRGLFEETRRMRVKGWGGRKGLAGRERVEWVVVVGGSKRDVVGLDGDSWEEEKKFGGGSAERGGEERDKGINKEVKKDEKKRENKKREEEETTGKEEAERRIKVLMEKLYVVGNSKEKKERAGEIN